MRRLPESWPTCPACGAQTRQQAVALVSGEQPSRATPFVIEQPTTESPAYGCEHCGTEYGNWLEVHADGG